MNVAKGIWTVYELLQGLKNLGNALMETEKNDFFFSLFSLLFHLSANA